MVLGLERGTKKSSVNLDPYCVNLDPYCVNEPLFEKAYLIGSLPS